jgi:NADPH:quinone reductase-like Zn-dependent oxidoreductase
MTLPTRMRALEAQDFSLDRLRLAERPLPTPRRGEILVRVQAASLNYRDLAILTERYLPNLPLPFVPASDCAGVVAALGEGVTRFQVGDAVVPCYIQGWHDGRPTQEQRSGRTLGGPLPGVLQDYIAVPAEDAVRLPAGLTPAEGATLPIAALTAWSTLQAGGLKPGDQVLVQGTGGVALFALQFARLAGAEVVALSSSDEKLARARALGAKAGINYRATPDWAPLVRQATAGRGADIVVETGGATLAQSLAATAFGGFVGVVGFVAGYEAAVPIRALIGPMLRVQGIAVGSRAGLEALGRAIGGGGIRPVIDRRFPLAEAAEAFRHLRGGGHFGKVVIDLEG